MKIFDRWGDLLFESDDIQKHWDGYFNGRKVEENRYLYHIEIIGEDDVLFDIFSLACALLCLHLHLSPE